jgi:hypothetical protein
MSFGSWVAACTACFVPFAGESSEELLGNE